MSPDPTREPPRLLWEADIGAPFPPAESPVVGHGLVLAACDGEWGDWPTPEFTAFMQRRVREPKARWPGWAEVADDRPVEVLAALETGTGRKRFGWSAPAWYGFVVGEPASWSDGSVSATCHRENDWLRIAHFANDGTFLGHDEVGADPTAVEPDLGLKSFDSKVVLAPLRELAGGRYVVSWSYRGWVFLRAECRRPGGELAWTAPEWTAAATAELVFGLGSEGFSRLVARAADTGEQLWARDGGSFTIAAIDDGLLLVVEDAHAAAGTPRRLLALRADTGEIAWLLECDVVSLVTGEGLVAVVTVSEQEGGSLRALRLRDGIASWQRSLDGQVPPVTRDPHPDPCESWPSLVALHDGHVIALHGTGRLESWHVGSDMGRAWTLDLPGPVQGCRASRLERSLSRRAVTMEDGLIVARTRTARPDPSAIHENLVGSRLATYAAP